MIKAVKKIPFVFLLVCLFASGFVVAEETAGLTKLSEHVYAEVVSQLLSGEELDFVSRYVI
jgi:hypothetical protein